MWKCAYGLRRAIGKVTNVRPQCVIPRSCMTTNKRLGRRDVCRSPVYEVKRLIVSYSKKAIHLFVNYAMPSPTFLSNAAEDSTTSATSSGLNAPDSDSDLSTLQGIVRYTLSESGHTLEAKWVSTRVRKLWFCDSIAFAFFAICLGVIGAVKSLLCFFRIHALSLTPSQMLASVKAFQDPGTGKGVRIEKDEKMERGFEGTWELRYFEPDGNLGAGKIFRAVFERIGQVSGFFTAAAFRGDGEEGMMLGEGVWPALMLT